MISRHEHLAQWIDFSECLELLYLESHGQTDQHTDRIAIAQQEGDLDQLDHVTAILLVLMKHRGKLVDEWMDRKWAALDRYYHDHFCVCEELKKK